MLPLGLEDIIRDAEEFDALHLQARLLQRLALGAGEEGLAVLEMAARELPGTCREAVNVQSRGQSKEEKKKKLRKMDGIYLKLT